MYEYDPQANQEVRNGRESYVQYSLLSCAVNVYEDTGGANAGSRIRAPLGTWHGVDNRTIEGAL